MIKYLQLNNMKNFGNKLNYINNYVDSILFILVLNKKNY